MCCLIHVYFDFWPQGQCTPRVCYYLHWRLGIDGSRVWTNRHTNWETQLKALPPPRLAITAGLSYCSNDVNMKYLCIHNLCYAKVETLLVWKSLTSNLFSITTWVLIHSQQRWHRQNSVKKVKVAHTRLPSVGFPSWSQFLTVSRQVMWIINQTVGCHSFPPGLQLPSQPLRGLLPILLLGEQRHNGCEQFA